jgi:TorA maturation chaperone TorD
MSTTSASTVLAPDPRRAAADRDAARADLCRYLAACYYEPGPEFAEERLFDSMVEAASRIDAELAAMAGRLRDAFQAASLQDLLVDYTRLFLGPVQALARPYASVWLSGESQVMQESTLAVQSMYAEGGFEIDEGFQDLPDHVAAELEFLYLLIHRDNEARWSGNADAMGAIGALRRRFLDGHLGRWLGPFLLAVHDGAQSDFYEVQAELTEAFVRREATTV